MQNRTFDPHLAANNRIHISLMASAAVLLPAEAHFKQDGWLLLNC
jgi:hypothetical protein